VATVIGQSHEASGVRHIGWLRGRLHGCWVPVDAEQAGAIACIRADSQLLVHACRTYVVCSCADVLTPEAR